MYKKNMRHLITKLANMMAMAALLMTATPMMAQEEQPITVDGCRPLLAPDCVVDDIVNELIPKAQEADGIVIGSPTHYAAATDDSRPVLMGVLLNFADAKLTCVATDGRRLALFWMEVDFPPEHACDVVLPARAVRELLRSLDKGELRVTIQGTQIIFEYGDHFFSSTLLNGTYPNYKQVVFSDCENKIKINREEFIAVLHRINVSTTPTTNAMRLTFEDNVLTIAVTSPDVDEATDTVTIKYNGPSIVAIFNPEFMLTPLENLTSDEVTIELNNASSPGLIKDDTNFLYVIMPLRV